MKCCLCEEPIKQGEPHRQVQIGMAKIGYAGRFAHEACLEEQRKARTTKKPGQ